MVSNTGSRSVGELLMMPRTWEVAFSRSRDSLSSREVAFCCSRASLSSREVTVCCAIASLSLRVSSAIFFLSLIGGVAAPALRRGGFTVLRRFVFSRVFRPVVTQSPNGRGGCRDVSIPRGASQRSRKRLRPGLPPRFLRLHFYD